MKSFKRLNSSVINHLLNLINDADGQEVLCAGRIDNSGIVCRTLAAARGNQTQVPALRTYIEKGDVVIHNHPSGNLEPSSADLNVASYLGNQGIGFFIIDNEVSKVYVVAEPIKKVEKVKIDPDELLDILSPGGALSKEDYYEYRDSQLNMLKVVTEAFNNNLISAVEAGTGVGKSLAYLLPAFKWVQKNEERVVISTATINLQQQLVDKDIPLVKKLLKTNAKTVLVKGRGNYVCLRRLNQALEENTLFREENDNLNVIREWVKITGTGSKSDLSFYPPADLWSKVCSEADACMGIRCSFRDNCFVLKARKDAASSRVLVVNHHLLFSDLAMRISGAGFENTAVLPPFNKIIFDEAHNIEKSATSYFSEMINKYLLYKQLARLFTNKKGMNYGVTVLFERITGPNKYLKKIPDSIKILKENMYQLDAMALKFLGDKYKYRLTEKSPDNLKSLVLDPLYKLQDELITLIDLIENALALLEDEEVESMPAYEIRIIQRKLKRFSAVCEDFRKYNKKPGKVVYLDKNRSISGERFVSFYITPLDISNVMKEAVFEPYKTVVCTSATLSVKNDFSFWMKRTGLYGYNPERVKTALFPSPFPYKDNVLLGVPVNAPEPVSDDYQSFISKYIGNILELSEGKGLVLFTSFSMLKETYPVVKERLKKLNISVLCQGDADRAKLLDKFNTDKASVLFATDSFWEGIDTPGEALQVLLICRLPFKVPTDPVIEARMEYIKEQGRNPFMDLFLPEAVMKLKQGFGRLIRHSNDRGVVVILDPRIVKKSYGSFFLDSLPQTGRSIKKDSFLLEDIENFLFPSSLK